MHQIRVHAQALGHPVLGDRKYGDRKLNQAMRRKGLRRMFLHAEGLRMKLAEKQLEFSAPMPGDLQSVLEVLRGG